MSSERSVHETCRAQFPAGLPEVPVEKRNLILEKESLSPVLRRFRVYAPWIARYAEPGHFVIVRGDERGERIPLTIADFHRQEGWIELVVQPVGAGTRQLDALVSGDQILDLVGPLGRRSEIARYGTVAMVGGGVGIAPIYPIQRAMKEAGNKVLCVIGARTKDLLFWEERMRATSDRLWVTTDDGSYGEKGFVTVVLNRLIDEEGPIDRVVAIGPAVMMRAVAETTRPARVKTIVSLNSVMVDGTGMCGGCRVEVGGKTKFTCVDGPEFDGHAVNFGMLLSRLETYADPERLAVERQAEDAVRQPAPVKAAERVRMPEQDWVRRRANFDEVALGYTDDMARAEAMRCLQCKKPGCVAGCPVNIDIPSFIRLIQAGRPLAAARKIKEQNNLPAVCGRVCPQETLCEAACVLAKKNQPIAIGRLERFAADDEAAREKPRVPTLPPPTGRHVAVVGAGPAGLTAAADLTLLGHAVTVFEALHAPGGVLAYGIPEFRLPKAIVRRECEYLESLGVAFRLDTPIGAGIRGQDLFAAGFDAVFAGTGAGLPLFLDIPGENLKGVYSANEFLTRVNLMKAFRFPAYGTPVLRARRAAVVGGGNVAMDSARSALRLGAESVTLLYRRTRKEMPARHEEIEHALEEGIVFRELTNPVRLLGEEKGYVKGVACLRMELGEPDASGRRRPVPVAGSEHVLDVDQFIIAIGNGPNPLLTKTWPELKLDARGNIPVDENQMTNLPGVFAGGDIVTGAATVIEAMGAGKRAARAIDAYLMGLLPRAT
jgi:glutamate synthase (NADPH/NADH) small chain